MGSTAATTRRTLRFNRKALEIGGIVASVVLVAFGVAAIVMGFQGRSTVTDNLKTQKIVGTPDMTPAATHRRGEEGRIERLDDHGSELLGREQPVNSGSSARGSAEYMTVPRSKRRVVWDCSQMPRDAVTATARVRMTQRPALKARVTRSRIPPATCGSTRRRLSAGSEHRLTWPTVSRGTGSSWASHSPCRRHRLLGLSIGGALAAAHCGPALVERPAVALTESPDARAAACGSGRSLSCSAVRRGRSGWSGAGRALAAPPGRVYFTTLSGSAHWSGGAHTASTARSTGNGADRGVDHHTEHPVRETAPKIRELASATGCRTTATRSTSSSAWCSARSCDWRSQAEAAPEPGPYEGPLAAGKGESERRRLGAGVRAGRPGQCRLGHLDRPRGGHRRARGRVANAESSGAVEAARCRPRCLFERRCLRSPSSAERIGSIRKVAMAWKTSVAVVANVTATSTSCSTC